MEVVRMQLSWKSVSVDARSDNHVLDPICDLTWTYMDGWLKVGSGVSKTKGIIRGYAITNVSFFGGLLHHLSRV